ncbi:hypothetical protein A5625_16590 [Mycobacterium sp. 1465703.0]|nr:hypothetical protein A5625_16590 [Mycobacterium sp. 1465703.0]
MVIFLAPGDGIADRAKQFLTAIFGLRAGSNAKSNAPVDFPKAMTPVNDDEAPAVGGVEAHVNGGHAVVVRDGGKGDDIRSGQRVGAAA